MNAAGARGASVGSFPGTRSATRIGVSTFGVLAGLAGIEHGIGEILQGNVAPVGIVIESWPRSEAFRILAGEPAMTVVPNLLATGILATLVSLVFLVWATMFVQREHGGLILVSLSVVMLLVGAGFGPPILGLVLGAAATRINAPLTWWRSHLSANSRRLLTNLWPWSFAASFTAWLLVMPGTIILDRTVGAPNPDLLVPVLTFSALGLLLLTILAGFARDIGRRDDPAPERR
ncbi:hypothetical protein GBA63_20200 [Rubrobacter tropicus]|uniref:Uncharacterized protein n=1 Tax=Rubrobacter tropicus TaxID=2653851 RepID=A0A6G8QE40_9ACTN|nr:hypothetical protein [Rubrobacter tropicus]QIN84712.1 hypothetical protein GBA63_20200 [Rubrobacter tropicus]